MKTDITPDNSVCPVYLEPRDPAQIEADQAEHDAQEEAKEQDDTARAAKRQQALDKLGLSDDEAVALFG